MTNTQSSYRQIFKATGLFGGVQIFNILIGIIRLKCIAVLLGPTGMGISGLLTSTTGVITGLTNFGLGTSAVKNVAEASAQHDKQRISVVVTTLRRLVWFTGLSGAFVTLILSPWLSQLTFNNSDYTSAFMLLSVTLLFSQLSIGQNVILQGTRKLKYLAKSNILGALSGLIIAVPLYFFLGIDGIVPVLIIISAVTLAISWYFSKKVSIEKIQLSFKEIWKEGKEMLTVGFMLSLGSLLSLSVSYLIIIFIRQEGGVEQVGLYNGGFIIIETYVGLIFNAMATDYYPRLSGIAHSNQLSKSTINKQNEIAILLLAPILMIFFIFIHWGILLLYSRQFIQIEGMIQWAALGMFFRALGWSIAFLFLAKGAVKLYFFNNLASYVYRLIFNIIGYKYWGLNGLGIAFLLTFIIYLLHVYITCNKKYDFSLDRKMLRIFFIQLSCAILCFCVVKFIVFPYQYLLGSILVILSSIYSFMELNKRINFMPNRSN